MPVPNTYIIGVQKAGTTSLNYWLSQHPDIFAPLELKDVDYFANPEIADHARERLIEDLSGYNGESVVLQSQVNYIFYPKALERIREAAPDAKVIIVLRDPVDRALSAYGYFKKMGYETRSPEAALLYKPEKEMNYAKANSDFTYLEHGMYGQQLEKVCELFDPKDILLLSFENLKKQPEKLIKIVFKFLNVDPTFIPTFRKRNQTGKIRFKWLQKKLTNSSRIRKKIIRYLFDWWLPPKKRQLLRKRLMEMNTTQANKKEHDEIKDKLHPVFEADQQKLKKVILKLKKSKKPNIYL